MEFKVGEVFKIVFIIDDDIIPTTASFTGDVIKMGTESIFMCILASGKEYGFTQAKLSQFEPLNNEANRSQAESITM